MLVVAIPAYNEEENIEQAVRSVPRRLKGINKVVVLVVDDGSTDRTSMIAKDAGAQVVRLAQNRGVGNAFQVALQSALDMGADIMVNMDADNQFDAREIPRLVAPILAGEADFVAGDRFTDAAGAIRRPEGMPATKYFGNVWMSRIISALAERSFADVSCGFRAYSREAMLQLNLTGRFTYTQETFLNLSAKGAAIESVPVSVRYSQERKSRVAGNIFRYAIHTMKIVLRAYRDYRPLRFFAYLGLVPLSIGLLCGLFVFGVYLATGAFTPYKFVGIAAIYLFSVGILLWIVGLLGDMFVRIRVNQEQLLYYVKKRQREARVGRPMGPAK